MTPHPSATHLLRPRIRWRRLIVLLLLMLGAAWFGRFAHLRISLRPSPRLHYWQYLMATLDPPPPGALPAEKALELMSAFQDLTGEEGSQDGEHPEPPLFTRAMRALIPNVPESDHAVTPLFSRPVFEQRRKALLTALAQGWQTDVDLASASAPFSFGVYAQMYRDPAGLLTRHASWARTTRSECGGVSPRALAQVLAEDWVALQRLARQAGQGRSVGSMAAMSDIESTLGEDLLAAAETGHAAAPGSMAWLGKLEVARLAAELEANRLVAKRPSLYFEADRLVLNAQLEAVYVREGGNWLDVSELVSGRRTIWFGPRVQVSRWWNLASPLFYTYEEAVRQIDSDLARLDSLTHLGAIREVEPGFEFDYSEEAPGVLSGHIRFDLSAAKGYLGSLYASRTRVEGGLTALALLAFRDRHGQYPDRLEELVPDHLPRLPVDYGDLKTLRYRRLGSDYLLYSVFADGVDDGGASARGDYGHPLGPDLRFHGPADEGAPR